MSNYKKYMNYLIALIVIASMSANLLLFNQVNSLKKSLNSSNSLISTKVESNIRAIMLAIKELQETETEEDMASLQKSAQQLYLNFNNWVDINQSDENASELLLKALKGFDALNNTIVHHLNNQYSSNNKSLTEHDIVVLDKIYDRLNKVLPIYRNIKEKAHEIKGSNKDDSGLGQWASSMEELSMLYRHSRQPNEHPKYMTDDDVLKTVDNMFQELSSFSGSKELTNEVQIRDGVHYYEVKYNTGNELSYLVWLDAIDGSLRKFEDYTVQKKNAAITNDEALKIAIDFMNKFESYDNFITGESLIKDDKTNDTIYAFQFIPVIGQINMISDKVVVNVSSKNEKVIKYSSDFSDTIIPVAQDWVLLKDIEDKYSNQLVNMDYKGLSVVRSFYTNYVPVVAYGYLSSEKGETKKLFFNISTGSQVYESYSVYQPVSYIETDENNPRN